MPPKRPKRSAVNTTNPDPPGPSGQVDLPDHHDPGGLNPTSTPPLGVIPTSPDVQSLSTGAPPASPGIIPQPSGFVPPSLSENYVSSGVLPPSLDSLPASSGNSALPSGILFGSSDDQPPRGASPASFSGGPAGESSGSSGNPSSLHGPLPARLTPDTSGLSLSSLAASIGDVLLGLREVRREVRAQYETTQASLRDLSDRIHALEGSDGSTSGVSSAPAPGAPRGRTPSAPAMPALNAVANQVQFGGNTASAQESIIHSVKSSPSPAPAVRFPAAAEILTARSVVNRVVAPRCNDETLLTYIMRRRDTIDLWLRRAHLPPETDTQYRERIHLREKILRLLPLIDAEDREAERSASATFPANPRRESPHPVFAPVPLRFPAPTSPRAPSAAPAMEHTRPLSIPRTTPFDRAVSEASDRMSRHRDQARDHIDRLLSEKIDRDRDEKGIADVLLKAKLPLPTKYNGAPNAEAFHGWMAGLVSWYSSLNLVGPELDGKRVELVQNCIEGIAQSWYYTEVLSPDRPIKDWTFRSLLHTMHNRFIPRSTRIEAATEWDNIAYSSDDASPGLWARMRVLAVRLPSYPDDYTQAKKFLEKLPKSIHDHLVLNEHMSAELNTAEELVAAAELIEDGQRLIRLHDAQLALMANRPDDSPRRSTRSSTATDASAQTAVADARPARTATTLPKPPAAKESRCFACGLVGHHAGDPRCSKSLRLHGARVLPEDEQYTSSDQVSEDLAADEPQAEYSTNSDGDPIFGPNLDIYDDDA